MPKFIRPQKSSYRADLQDGSWSVCLVGLEMHGILYLVPRSCSLLPDTGILEVLDKHRNTQSGLVWYLLLATKIKGSKEYLQGHRQIASPCKACLADIRDQKNVFEELMCLLLDKIQKENENW